MKKILLIFIISSLIAISLIVLFVSYERNGDGSKPSVEESPTSTINKFSSALKAGNTAKALDFVAAASKEKFQRQFDALGEKGIAELVKALENATLVEESQRHAEFEVTFTIDREIIKSDIILVKTPEGWKISQL